jgi:indolepyruvate ferredoxin oxidoreductase beta subunit
MAQRYGSVMGFIRIGISVKSPLFDPGEADYILGLELTETLRRLHYISNNGLVIAADEYKPSYAQSVTHPSLKAEDIAWKIKSLWPKTIIIPARRLAEKAGSIRALNMVILGTFNALSNLLSTEGIKTAIRKVLPEQATLISIKAYELGYLYPQQAL